MKEYTNEEISDLVKTAVTLGIPLYKETRLEEIETLIKHKYLAEHSTPIPEDSEYDDNPGIKDMKR